LGGMGEAKRDYEKEWSFIQLEGWGKDR